MLRSFILSILLLIAFGVNAETTVIKGSLLQDVTRTPVLGGGFSLSTMDYKSKCYGGVVTTEPTYDVEYSFREITDEYKRSLKRAGSFESNFTYWFVSGKIGASIERSSSTGIKRTSLLAKIKLKTYYASLDEANSKMSNEAINLLKSRDTIGFFDACGAYYIKSITRVSTIMAMLTFNEKNDKSESKYKANLDLRIRRKGGVKHSFESEESSKDLKRELIINVVGMGLAKEHVANMSPTTIENFRKVVEGAMKSMTGVHTGRVTGIEIIPWTANLSFQNQLKVLLKEKADEKGEDAKLSEKDRKREKDGKLDFKEKRIISENGEFIAQLKDKYRKLQEYYFSAMNCRQKLDNILKRTDKTGEIYDSSKLMMFDNNKVDGKDGNQDLRISAKDMKTKLKEQTSGGEDGKGGLIGKWDKLTTDADNCFGHLENHFASLSYRDIDSCKKLVPELTVPMPWILTYCEPMIDSYNTE